MIDYMNIQNIREYLENDQLEFKRKLPESQKLAHEVMALASSKGGNIVIV